MAPEHRGLEIGGTWYGLEFQRTVVNTECKYLLLKYAFETLGCIRVQFKTDLRNERSQKAIERIGAVKREGVLRNHMILPDGRYRAFGVLQYCGYGMARGEEAFGSDDNTIGNFVLTRPDSTNSQ
jgi:RimJ/RimL family protein N-acetyltransferase